MAARDAGIPPFHGVLLRHRPYFVKAGHEPPESERLLSQRPFDTELQEAVAAGRERRYQDAVVILTGLLRRSDEYPEALLYLGRSYHALGEHARAVAVLTFFLRLAPGSASGYFFLGRAYLAMGQHREALRHLKRAADLRPGHAAALALAGMAFLRIHRTADAVDCLQRAVEAAPDNARVFTAYLNALLTQAIRLFRAGDLTLAGQMFQFILRFQESSVTAHLYLGRIFRDLGRSRVALEHFDAAARLSPDDPALRLQKATLHLAAGEPEAALAELKEASTGGDARAFLTRDPVELSRLLAVAFFQNRRYRDTVTFGIRVLKESRDEPRIHVIVAEALRNLGDLDKARNHYQRALQVTKGDPQILFGLAMVLLEQKDYAELRSVLARIERLRPGDVTTAYYLALCRSRSGDDPAVTIDLLQKQIHEKGPDPFLMQALGRDYLRAGLPDLAEGWFRRTMRVRPDDPEAVLGLLEAGERLGSVETRREAYDAYLKLDPGARDRRREYVKLLISLDQHAEATGHIERLVAGEPRNRTLRELLATCYRRTGRYADAIVILKELLRADPASEEHLKALLYCLEKAGDREMALRLVESAAPSFPKSGTLRQIQGLLLMRAGKLERAAAVFRQVASLDPRGWVAYENLGRIHEKMGDATFARKFYDRARTLREGPPKKEPRRPARGGSVARPRPRR